MLQVVS